MFFESIASKFHFRFKDRINAACILGKPLKDKIKTQDRGSAIVLGIPRGVVITAEALAKKLSMSNSAEWNY